MNKKLLFLLVFLLAALLSACDLDLTQGLYDPRPATETTVPPTVTSQDFIRDQARNHTAYMIADVELGGNSTYDHYAQHRNDPALSEIVGDILNRWDNFGERVCNIGDFERKLLPIEKGQGTFIYENARNLIQVENGQGWFVVFKGTDTITRGDEIVLISEKPDCLQASGPGPSTPGEDFQILNKSINYPGITSGNIMVSLNFPAYQPNSGHDTYNYGPASNIHYQALWPNGILYVCGVAQDYQIYDTSTPTTAWATNCEDVLQIRDNGSGNIKYTTYAGFVTENGTGNNIFSETPPIPINDQAVFAFKQNLHDNEVAKPMIQIGPNLWVNPDVLNPDGTIRNDGPIVDLCAVTCTTQLVPVTPQALPQVQQPQPQQTSPQQAQPQPVSKMSHIAFESQIDYNMEAFVMNEDGSQVIRLSYNAPFFDHTPAWSPDGRRLVFTSENGSGADLYVINFDGSGLTKLTNAGWNSQPDWSPDGKKIVFSAPDGIDVINPDGSNQIQLTNIWQSSSPKWSPDGKKIAFSTVEGLLYVMGADGSHQANLKTDVKVGETSLRWSPDGKKIVFDTDSTGYCSSTIYIINADGSRLTNLTDDSASCQPEWSPDGKKIAFVSTRDGNEEIYVMNANGNGQTNVSNNSAYDASPTWSPDGKKIAFMTNRDDASVGFYDIYVMNADGSGQINLYKGNSRSPVWSPK